MTCFIPLSRGLEAAIDDADYASVSALRWHAVPSTQYEAKFYARGPKGIYLHRFLLQPQPGIEVDHIDRNPLNNTRANLRLANRSKNCANSLMPQGPRTPYRGVYWVEKKGKYQAKIQAEWTIHRLGYFRDAVEAALAYDRAATSYFGEFAQLNLASESDIPLERVVSQKRIRRKDPAHLTQDKWQEILSLKDRGLSRREIAALYGCSHRTVENCLSRARKTLVGPALNHPPSSSHPSSVEVPRAADARLCTVSG